MKAQNFNNHARYVIGFHFFAYGLILLLLITSVVLMTQSLWLFAGILFVNSIVLFLLGWYSRVFALKAQDRAIRIEENFRHFILTGKPLGSNLRTGQIVALRFASDDELPALALKAESEKLKGKQIKQLIKNWRPDYHRV